MARPVDELHRIRSDGRRTARRTARVERRPLRRTQRRARRRPDQTGTRTGPGPRHASSMPNDRPQPRIGFAVATPIYASRSGAPRYKDHLLLTSWEGADKRASPRSGSESSRTVGFASGIGSLDRDRDRWRTAIGGYRGRALADILDDADLHPGESPVTGEAGTRTVRADHPQPSCSAGRIPGAVRREAPRRGR